MRSYVYWLNMYNAIEELVTPSSKATQIKFSNWPASDISWERLHVDFVGSLSGIYYFIVVDNFTKWPEVLKSQ